MNWPAGYETCSRLGKRAYLTSMWYLMSG
uniref:Uncharacterized protein n=1 Tax=Musa acuminata subsp. malaccensis TaxID=214687 RepID=A0A804KFB9_MUSAM